MSELRLKSTGTIKLFENDNTSSVTIASPASLGADRTVTLPDADVTLVSGTMSTGLTAADITGATALGAAPANTDEFVLSDAGVLKRVDFSHMANTPAFVAYNCDSQSGVTDNTDTKLSFTEILDTNGCFATGTTFTPGVAGYYFFTGLARASTASANFGARIVLYLNGAQIPDAGGGKQYFNNGSSTTLKAWQISCTTIVYMNNTDYMELYMGCDGDSETFNIDDDGHFSGFRVAGLG